MGIHGVFKEINPSSERISLAKFAAQHIATHSRPLVLAIDTAIWLFQIQSGKGGSNPALRTFYYRLLRLLSLNIRPLFVFDGPNKPTWKRNKKVGGPGVRVASVPEFLAKQLLKQFGFPVHIAPGEAEAECAVLQKAGIVDAVMSEDVDTLMFGSGILLRNWTPEGSSKTPTHVTVYRATDAKSKCGLDGKGMVLVALMSGGDYIVEGIPGCGPKVACDAARAGYGEELCTLAARKDTAGIAEWRQKLQHQIRTNEAKIFSRKNSTLVIPDDFPNLEVLGYYTSPSVSSRDKLLKLKDSINWDQQIDFPSLRTFAAEAFDWRCLGGAKKFIRNLAPAMLVRELRLRGDQNVTLDNEAQEAREKELIVAIHGKRNHFTTDGELEFRVSFVPSSLVPIDLSIEEEDELSNGVDADSEAENEAQGPNNDGAEPGSPSKKKAAKPYEPNQPEKLWLMKTFLQLGSPLLIEDYEASLLVPRWARLGKKNGTDTGTAAKTAKKSSRSKAKGTDMPPNAILAYANVTKPIRRTTKANNDIHEVPELDLRSAPTMAAPESVALESLVTGGPTTRDSAASAVPTTSFRLPNIQRKIARINEVTNQSLNVDSLLCRPSVETIPRIGTQASGADATQTNFSWKDFSGQKTPQRRTKRVMVASPSPVPPQRTIDSYWSPSPRKAPARELPGGVVSLLSSSPAPLTYSETLPEPPLTPSPGNLRERFVRHNANEMMDQGLLVSPTQSARRVSRCLLAELSPVSKLPESVTRRSKKRQKTAERGGRGVMERVKTAPVYGRDDESDLENDASHGGATDGTPTCLRDIATPRRRSEERGGLQHIDLTVSSPLQPATLSTMSNARDVPSHRAPISTAIFSDVSAEVSPGLEQSELLRPNEPTDKFGRRVQAEQIAPSEPSLSRDLAVDICKVPIHADSGARRPKEKKKFLILRESLPGSFKEADDLFAIDLTGVGIPVNPPSRKPPISKSADLGRPEARLRKGWRQSQVEILDLTAV